MHANESVEIDYFNFFFYFILYFKAVKNSLGAPYIALHCCAN